MSWVKERITILIMSTPESSSRYGHVICTAGITEDNEWRRLWSITPQIKKKYKIKRWDIIETNVRTTNDQRIETRKIDPESIKNYAHIQDWNHKNIIEGIADNSLDDITNAGRSIGILKPNIKRLKLIPSTTKDDKSFGKVFPKYHFKCDIQCSMCSSQYAYHKMKCRDWGSNVLCRKVKNKPNGNDIIKQKLLDDMKNKFDTWFGVGTHRRWQTWMIVALFWFTKNV